MGILGEKILTQLTRMNRYQGMDSLITASHFLEETCQEMGLKYTTHVYKYDQTGGSFGISGNMGWECITGIIKMILPREEILEDYEDSEYVVTLFSPAGKVTAEVVIPDANWSNVKDKIVLIELPADDFLPNIAKKWHLAREHQAKALIWSRERLLDAYSYHGVGSSISKYPNVQIPIVQLRPSVAKKLRDLMTVERVLLEVDVESQRMVKDMPVVEAIIEGELEEALVFSAHYCHAGPGANDNASGTAGLFEIAHRLKLLGKPRYTMIFLWIPEYAGSERWLERNTRPISACINLDMIAASQQNSASSLFILDPLLSQSHLLSSYVNYFFNQNNRQFDSFLGENTNLRYRLARLPYQVGSDSDMFSLSGIPSLFIFTWPDPYYHSSEDSIDKLDLSLFDMVVHSLTQAVWAWGNQPNKKIELSWAYQTYGLAHERSVEDIVASFLNKSFSVKLPSSWKPSNTLIKPILKQLLLMNDHPLLVPVFKKWFELCPDIPSIMLEAVILSSQFDRSTVVEILRAEFSNFNLDMYNEVVAVFDEMQASLV